MSDIYDEAVAYLTERPKSILQAWNYPTRFGGILFRKVDGLPVDDSRCGCLTQIRLMDDFYRAPTNELTLAIRADKRIPSDQRDITVVDLPAFAEWNRRLDKELNRPVPTHI